MYITFEEYSKFHNVPAESDFMGYELRARRIIDNLTTGVDGVAKLQEFFPTDVNDAEIVTLTISDVIFFLYQTQEYSSRTGLVPRPDGTFAGAIVKSISSGSESITYDTESSVYALTGAEKDAYISGMVTNGLRGAKDRNGVNLLYMGEYPRVR